MGNNVLANYTTAAQWRVSGSWSSGSDASDTAHPTRWLFDRAGNRRSSPLGASINAQTEVSLLMDLVAGTDGLSTIDTVFIWNHNLNALGANTVIQLDVSDAADFASSITMAQWNSPATAKPLLALSLHGSGIETRQRYTSVRYMRLRITKTSGALSSGTVPSIGELWVGRRRQWSYFPDLPWEERSLESDVVDFAPESGNTTRYTRWTGRRTLEGTIRSGGDDKNGLNLEAEMRAWFDECELGKESVVITSPYSNPLPSVVLPTPPLFAIPKVGPFERENSFTLIEKAPFLYNAGNGATQGV